MQDGIPLPGVGGTSCASPTFSGIIALLNDARLAAGKSALGFLNPLLYQLAAEHSDSFFDVTVGANRCGVIDFDPNCCDSAYHAAVGWYVPFIACYLLVVANLARVSPAWMC